MVSGGVKPPLIEVLDQLEYAGAGYFRVRGPKGEKVPIYSSNEVLSLAKRLSGCRYLFTAEAGLDHGGCEAARLRGIAAPKRKPPADLSVGGYSVSMTYSWVDVWIVTLMFVWACMGVFALGALASSLLAGEDSYPVWPDDSPSPGP